MKYYQHNPHWGKDARAEMHSPQRCFLADPTRDQRCKFCGKPEDEHCVQQLDSWATSTALLNSGILKLRRSCTPTTVYRGVSEKFIQLPRDFVQTRDTQEKTGAFAKGVEPAPMSTTEDEQVALSYTGDDVGSLYTITFDALGKPANLAFLSQYPAEKELVFPPNTTLTCMDVVAISGQPSKRRLKTPDDAAVEKRLEGERRRRHDAGAK